MNSFQFATPRGPFNLSQLAKVSGALVFKEESGSFMVSNIATLSAAQSDNLSMLHQKKYLKALKSSQAGACIIAPEYIGYAPQTMHLLVHQNPYKAYALVLQAFYPEQPFSSFTAPSAYISATATIGKECFIAHGAYIGENVSIGERCKIGVNAVIGDGVVMGDDCRIESSVSIAHSIIGNRVLVYAGARIGQDGFGFASDAQGHYKIPHRGGVLIGNDVEIGANTCIDRGSLENTVIEDWCRVDNLVQIGHNVTVGKNTIICGQVGIAGSSNLGEFVILSGKVGISGHLTIGNQANILVGSTVIQDVEPGARMGGYPAVSDRSWHKQTRFLKKNSKTKT
ncbi:UDP-3-O-acylglucosamine N-acyltransferase 2 [Legionella antarctica]|uniref:UDP-3-O-acylglucosamine N-acyltransferase n=1 Tax=Legionella antarctica TaxID=2708020 RepID=A0A6F8T8W6_9GAMM|nr:UDP-3-O-(3-hydroxymyristoyl)glucosamine N-acyltransferase [Legionella antarctica]BCA96600.1 UDP-3-O-acylglucosamine N-acyltransferase 2 [Legionella antarctica]